MSLARTVGANLAHGLGHGPIGALVSAWPALALTGSFELLMTLIRTGKAVATQPAPAALEHQPGCAVVADVPAALPHAPDLEQSSGIGTERATVSVPSLANSTSIGGRSSVP